MPPTPELSTYKSSHSASTASSSAHDHNEPKEVCDRPVNLKTDPDNNPESQFSDSESAKSHGSANVVVAEHLEPQLIPLSVSKSTLGGSFCETQSSGSKRRSLRDYQAHLEHLERQENDIKKGKSVCSIF